MKYVIVSGSPRSGTSATMRVLIASKYNVHGDKFPRLANKSKSEIEKYMQSKKEEEFKPEEQLNEKGYFEEGGMVMKGISKTLDCHLHTIPDGSVIKIIGKGLRGTDPDLVGHLVYCLRDPITCGLAQLSLTPRSHNKPAKEKRKPPMRDFSRINLTIDLRPKKANPTNSTKTSKKEGRPLFRSKPELEPKGNMWHRDTLAFLNFTLSNPEVPVFISDYKEFSTDQKGWIKKCSSFLRRDLVGIETIKPRKPKEVRQAYWDDLMLAYTLILEGDLLRAKEVLENVDFSTKSTQFVCPRAGRVDKAQCADCYKQKKPALKKMMIRRAEHREIDWENEPCFLECDKHGLSVQESITNNFWRTK